TRASIRTREAPMIPSDTGAILTGPKLTGRFEKSEGNGSSSLVHTIPAPARSMSESPSVMMRTSQCVAETARRMTTRSTTYASAPPVTPALRALRPVHVGPFSRHSPRGPALTAGILLWRAHACQGNRVRDASAESRPSRGEPANKVAQGRQLAEDRDG